jgi:ABC-type sugar transport system permease subunit
MKKTKIPSRRNIFLRLPVILVVVGVAGWLRWHAVVNLPVDYDEDDYIRAAQQYTAIIRSGDWQGFLQTNYRPEHPPLEKIAFGFSLLAAPPEPLTPDRPTTASPDSTLPRGLLRPARITSAVFGTIEILLISLVNPLAGLLLGIHAFTIKYTSQVMLESLPALTSLACVMAYMRWKKRSSYKFNYWLVGSAIFLGLTAASKYLYCVVGIAILVDWLLESRQTGNLRRSFPLVMFWGLLALAIFFAADPYLWPDPFGRLKNSVLYHAAYAAGASEVQNSGYPIWQPFIWLNTTPYAWHPQAFYFAIDPLVTLLAVFGIVSMWKNQRLYLFWLGIALIFLLIWPTKWPQYLLILTAPLALVASEGLMNLTIRPFRSWLTQRKTKRIRASSNRRGDGRRALPWLIPGLVAFAILTLFPFIFQFGVSLTNFSVNSLRDGFNGGLWRAIWGGLTGQIHAVPFDLGRQSSQVQYTGLAFYQPVLSYLASNGILVFDVLWTALSVLLQTLLGLGLALLLWQKGARFGKFWQVIFILPWAIPEMVGALMWLNIFMPDWGWLALAVQKYGPHFPFAFFIGWERTTNLWLLVFLIPAVWYGFPFMMLASSVGLKTVPPDVFDAAAVDGANAWNTFRYVTWPLLFPLIVPAIIIRSIFAFNQFYLFQAFGFGDSTLATLSYNIFNPTSGARGLSGGMFSVSAIINIITVIILAGLVFLFNRWSKAGEGVTYA